MNSETKQCQNCKNDFTIEPEDFVFYEKIQVPPPTWCPECRFQRRLTFLNFRNLYKRTCGLCKKDAISAYSPDKHVNVYCSKCWWSDDWDPRDYGRDYDFSRPFFTQYSELLREAPVIGISIDIPTFNTSPYTHHAGELKNCYLLFFADYCQDSAYGFGISHNTSCFDCSVTAYSEQCYDSMHSFKNNGCVGLRSQVTNSIDSFFLRDCNNCHNCFGSANLYNASYVFFNKQLTKEAYKEKLASIDLGSYTEYRKLQTAVESHWNTLPPKPVVNQFVQDCTGSYVFESKNCKECFEVVDGEDSKFIWNSYKVRDCYDISNWGENLTESYECSNVGTESTHLKFCFEAGLGTLDAEYCKLSTGGKYHFGCVSVRKPEYCILNKQYTEEEYEELVPKIKEHMNSMPYVDAQGRIYRYGEFFPPELSLFAYNESIANDFFPLSKEEIEAQGFSYKKYEKSQHSITTKAGTLPDHIKDVTDSILKEVIECDRCSNGFRIISMELGFLKNRNLPLPRQCPMCRIKEKYDLWIKNLRMIPRTCDKCDAEFITKYTKEEAPHMLCKDCYLKEFV